MSSPRTSIAAGVTVAVIGVLPVLWMLGLEPTEETIEPPLVLEEPTTTVAAPTTTIEPTVVTVTVPTPQIAGIGDATTRVLHARGFSEHMTTDEVAGAIPPTVFRLLAERGVTLAIATDDPTGPP